MRTTVDIADDQYATLKTVAAREHTSVRALLSELIANHITSRLGRGDAEVFRLPVIGERGERKLELDHERVAELLMDELPS